MTRMLVPWGGLVDINLGPGETVIVAPATGSFGTGAVQLALAMGARVIAMGRNAKVLAQLNDKFSEQYPTDRLLTVPITGNLEEEMAALKAAAGSRPIDAFYDISPDAAVNATYFKAAIMSLRHSGRISLMGGQRSEDVKIPYHRVMHWNLQLKGKWMYEREDVPKFLRLVEAGNLSLGGRAGAVAVKEFGLGQWKEAFDYASDHASDGQGTCLVPSEA
jgi:D-arabinose 1-dehydrogenase-like Zn-dependent alcohol dehydrogenase